MGCTLGSVSDLVSPWQDTANALDLQYASEYLFPNRYRADNPFQILFPPVSVTSSSGVGVDITDSFFGTKVLNIFIIQQPYGWVDDTFEWGTVGSPFETAVSAAILTWNTTQAKRFPYYKCLVFADFWTLNKDPTPDAELQEYIDKFEDTVDKFKEVIPTITGFQYGGDLNSQVEASFFAPYIDAFFAKPRYKL